MVQVVGQVGSSIPGSLIPRLHQEGCKIICAKFNVQRLNVIICNGINSL